MRFCIFAFLAFSLAACEKKADSGSSDSGVGAAAVRYLYIASGLCQAGANTTFTATTSSNRVYRVSLATGVQDLVLADFNAPPATSGDTPVGIVPYDSGTILALIERTGARRIERIPKSNFAPRITFSTDTAGALTNALLGMTATNDNAVLINRTNGVAKINSAGITSVATFVNNAPGGACGATNNKYVALSTTAFGHMFFGNSVAANNRIGIIRNSGTACLAGTAAPIATAFPTASAFIPSAGQMLVSYAGNSVATDANSIYMYPITETSTTASLGAGVKIYDAADFPGSVPYLLYGISAMAYEPSESALYVATAISTATTIVQYNIEKLIYDPLTPSLTRVGTTPFMSYNIDTKCISSMYVGY